MKKRFLSLKTRATIETQAVLATHQVQVSASIGICPPHGEDCPPQYAAADLPMCLVKAAGKVGTGLAEREG